MGLTDSQYAEGWENTRPGHPSQYREGWANGLVRVGQLTIDGPTDPVAPGDDIPVSGVATRNDGTPASEVQVQLDGPEQVAAEAIPDSSGDYAVTVGVETPGDYQAKTVAPTVIGSMGVEDWANTRPALSSFTVEGWEDT